MENWLQSIQDGEVIVYLGAKTLEGSMIPWGVEPLILALNGGRAMMPKLMGEVAKAAMAIEGRRGRGHLEGMCAKIFSLENPPTEFQKRLVALKPRVVIDTNYDSGLPLLYQQTPHFLLKGFARIAAGPSRFEGFVYRDGKYLPSLDWDGQMPLLYKPLGCILPNPNFVISDADFVDWLTEAMGGFAFPIWFKEFRKNKKALFLGTSFSLDTTRMVAREILQEGAGGVVVKDEPLTKSEVRFFEQQSLTCKDANHLDFITQLEGEK
jgi:hypothetical protein